MLSMFKYCRKRAPQIALAVGTTALAANVACNYDSNAGFVASVQKGAVDPVKFMGAVAATGATVWGACKMLEAPPEAATPPGWGQTVVNGAKYVGGALVWGAAAGVAAALSGLLVIAQAANGHAGQNNANRPTLS
jgi:hypothetical protein